MTTQVLVTGGTGNLGSEIVRQLVAAGVSVRALARNPQRRQGLPESVQLIAGDLGQSETLRPAMQGMDALLLLSGMDPAQVHWQSNAIQAAKQAGVRRIVKMSAILADPNSTIPICRWHGQTEQELAAAGVDYTNLRPNFFMQNMLGNAATINSQGAFYGCAKDGRASTVDIRDIAAVAVACLTKNGHSGKTYLVTGPEALSFSEMAQNLAAALGRPVNYVDMPADAFRGAMIASGMPDWLADCVTGLYSAAAEGNMETVEDTVRRVAGREPIPFDLFARESAAFFNAQTTTA